MDWKLILAFALLFACVPSMLLAGYFAVFFRRQSSVVTKLRMSACESKEITEVCEQSTGRAEQQVRLSFEERLRQFTGDAPITHADPPRREFCLLTMPDFDHPKRPKSREFIAWLLAHIRQLLRGSGKHRMNGNSGHGG